jgi:small subunit ribosomal protein S1
MSSNNYRNEFSAPPPLEESYWAALLREGENAELGLVAHEHEAVRSAHIVENMAPTPSITNGNTSLAQDWADIAAIMENDEVIQLNVIGYNRGGLLVEWRSLHGFVPASQLVEFSSSGSNNLRRSTLVNLVGQALSLRVIELNSEQNRLILSERAAQVGAGERASIMRRLKPGDTISGMVTNLCDFGAFVDLGGLEGLIHISELSWGRVGHPMDILGRGQEVTAYVLDIDREAGRIALSLKRLRPDPWETVTQRYHIGDIIHGTVTNVVDFGAFACIEEGLEGLIHVSELAEGHFLHPRNVVNEGQPVTARVLSIDSHARRLGLSLRLNA